ncbi:MAG: twin-arginine translocase TatA/TatE family subunit [Candidatus Dormiibacterota bacterium]|jgi:Sec-independent protein translocase protein TatA|nr:twin-arginine translocase TatA/TatE family subunit [Candidatus Dormibacteraeota bacterium]
MLGHWWILLIIVAAAVLLLAPAWLPWLGRRSGRAVRDIPKASKEASERFKEELKADDPPKPGG